MDQCNVGTFCQSKTKTVRDILLSMKTQIGYLRNHVLVNLMAPTTNKSDPTWKKFNFDVLSIGLISFTLFEAIDKAFKTLKEKTLNHVITKFEETREVASNEEPLESNQKKIDNFIKEFAIIIHSLTEKCELFDILHTNVLLMETVTKVLIENKKFFLTKQITALSKKIDKFYLDSFALKQFVISA